MTTEHRGSSSRNALGKRKRKRKRRHAAAGARVLVVGLSASTAVALAGAIGGASRSAPPAPDAATTPNVAVARPSRDGSILNGPPRVARTTSPPVTRSRAS
jgi:hypothetical protein